MSFWKVLRQTVSWTLTACFALLILCGVGLHVLRRSVEADFWRAGEVEALPLQRAALTQRVEALAAEIGFDGALILDALGEETLSAWQAEALAWWRGYITGAEVTAFAPVLPGLAERVQADAGYQAATSVYERRTLAESGVAQPMNEAIARTMLPLRTTLLIRARDAASGVSLRAGLAFLFSGILPWTMTADFVALGLLIALSAGGLRRGLRRVGAACGAAGLLLLFLCMWLSIGDIFNHIGLESDIFRALVGGTALARRGTLIAWGSLLTVLGLLPGLTWVPAYVRRRWQK